jgi:hypothetical protein
MLSPSHHQHAAVGSPGPGARALYLGTRDKKHVSCTAEALVVRNDRAQTLRYPLVRVARVVSSTVVDWSGAALALCLQHGIGISWVNARGEALGTCYPHLRQHPQFASALDLWLETPDGPERYQLWLRARRMDVLMRWGQAQADTISPATWEATKHDWVYARQFRQHLPDAIRGHLLAYIGSQLAAHGAPPLLWDAQSDAVDLDADLCELLWAEMNLCTGDLADTTSTDKETIALFERWIARNGAALLLHLNSLYRTAMKATKE